MYWGIITENMYLIKHRILNRVGGRNKRKKIRKMIQYIKYHPQFHKQCEKLKKSNDKASKAVENAREIILAFKKSRKNFNFMGALSHSGELRLKAGMKYRLGNGYRLVLSMGKECLFVLCIGSHDQCDKWLEKNRGEESFSFSWKEKVLMKHLENKESQQAEMKNEPSDFCIQIDDRILRQIFQGITQQG
jgi:mRNA-degrading endonuclease RelE of RelBE toxin-antitoxin system